MPWRGIGGVDGVGIGADDGHEVGFGRSDVDLAGGCAGGDGDVVGVAVEVWRAAGDETDGDGNGGGDGVGGEVDDRDGAVAEREGCSGSGAGQVGVAAVDDVGAVLPSCRTPTMRGLMPTGTVARTVPKPTASTGLLGSQLGLVGRALAEQSGMLMMLTEPGWTPSPALATTISLRAGRSLPREARCRR